MELPDLVESALEPDESVLARVSLGGEDALFVTSERSLVYRAEGLLSDESTEEYPHTAERISVSEGRRKSSISLDYGLEGERTLKLPSKHLDDALEYLLAGVLDATGVLDEDEEVTHVFRFSELTLVVTSKRLVRHIGAPVWDEDFEAHHYEDVTDLDFEEGSVATSIVLTLGDRQERFKAPNEQARAVREALTSALLDYHDIGSLEELRVTKEAEAEAEEAAQEDEDSPFGEGPDPLGANPTELPDESVEAAEQSGPAGAGRSQQASPESTAETAESAGTGAESASRTTESTPSFEESGFEAAGPVEEQDLAAEVEALREEIERQSDLLEQQQETIQQLIDELRRGR